MLATGVAAALAVYFVLSFYLLPQSFQDAITPPMPEAIISDVTISQRQVSLGDTFTISVSGTNSGDDADMQIVSIGFPNLTTTGDIEVLRHDFRQTPLRIERGDDVGSGYSGSNLVKAQYPSIEAFSRPWERGSTYTIDLEIKPQTAGNFVMFVKSVGLPHSSDRAHYPQQGLVDFQREFVESYSVQVTKS